MKRALIIVTLTLLGTSTMGCAVFDSMMQRCQLDPVGCANDVMRIGNGGAQQGQQ